MKAELDATKAKLDELTKKMGEPEDESKMDAKIAERSSVLDAARRVLGPDAKLDGKSNDAIRREVITKMDGAAALLEGDKPRAPELVKVYFEARTRSVAQAPAPRGDARQLPAASFPGATQASALDVSSLYTPPGRR